MSYRFNRMLVLSLAMMFAAASIAIGTAPYAQSGGMQVTGMTPTTGGPGTIITITGANFGSAQGPKLVAINLERVNLMEVRYWSNTKILAVVPNLPVGEYTVVVYHNNSYRTGAPWTISPRFRIIPRELPRDIGESNDVTGRPVPRPSCTPISGSANMLCNANFNVVGPNGPEPRIVTLPAGGGAGYTPAANWMMFINGSDPITTSVEPSDAPSRPFDRGPRKMIHVVTHNWATGILQQFLARDMGPKRVSFSVWVKAVRGKVAVSLGNWGLKIPGGWHVAAETKTTGKWELLTGCNVYDEKLPLNQIFIASSEKTVAEFYVGYAEVRNADISWTQGGCRPSP